MIPEKVRTILLTVAAGAVLIIGGLFITQTGDIKFCVSSGECYSFNKDEYTALKLGLVAEYESGDPLTYTEYQLLIAVYDFEAKKGNLIVRDARLDNLIPQLNAELKRIPE
ncbi:MAG: hypothetical protein FVQ79_03365 [Planctomycetes bacterium]|nr:hypothetical protein [Planctomycetota bacterium]